MRTISAGLKTAIATGKIANLLKITLKDSTEYLYTDHDMKITIGGDTYEPGEGLSKIKLETSSNAEVSSQQLQAAWLDVPEEDLLAGKYDNAVVEISWTSWDDPAQGLIKIFVGRISKINWTEEGFRASIQNYIRELDNVMGTIYTPSCRHQLGDAISTGKIGACGVSLGSYTFAGTVSTILTQGSKFKLTGTAAAQVDKYFSNGKLTWTSGLNSGTSTEVKVHEKNADSNIGDSIELFIPSPYNIQTGDTFSVIAGCDKSFVTCKAKFSNVNNFGGFPHINTEINYR